MFFIGKPRKPLIFMKKKKNIYIYIYTHLKSLLTFLFQVFFQAIAYADFILTIHYKAKHGCEFKLKPREEKQITLLFSTGLWIVHHMDQESSYLNSILQSIETLRAFHRSLEQQQQNNLKTQQEK